MSTYKVIQDIEADDKLIWQLSFRQFVYAFISAIVLYISYLFLSGGLFFVLFLTIPIALFTGFLAYPFGKDQPTEIWALARLRFLLKPKNRIWAQSGVKELVTITVPKKVEVNLTDGLSETEVKSRLQALADTIDTRGWTIKNIDTTYQSPLETEASDRLLERSEVQTIDDYGADDILDVDVSPIAQKMDQLLISNSNKHRQELIDNLDKMREQESLKANSSGSQGVASTGSAFGLADSTDDQLLGADLKAKNKRQHLALDHLKTIKTDRDKPDSKLKVKSSDENDPDIINLSRRNDLNIDVIGHEIDKARGIDLDSSQGEVTISLH